MGRGTLRVELLEDRSLPALVAAFDFGEAAGTAVLDASGNGLHGTISGATRTAGKYGGALSFNGAGNWVTVPDAGPLDLTTGMTLEAWVRPAAAASNWTTALLKERPGGLAYALYAADGAGAPPAGYINRNGADVKAAGAAALPLNAWSHLAVTYDGAALRLYVNGAQVGSTPQTGSITTSTGPLRIGGNAVWGEYFNGLIDEIRVYNHALTAAQVQTDMDTPISGGAPDTIPPAVSLTAPAGGSTVSGAVTVSASASDNVGVAGVQFVLDGVNLGAEDTTAPYSVSWNTTTATNGTHTLTAVARDAAGNATTSAAVTVTVSNAGGVALTINGAQTFQTIDGFGVNANAHSWNGGELRPALDMLHDLMGATLFRVCYDMVDWESSNDNLDPNTPDWTYYNALYSNASFQELWSTIRYLNQKGVTGGITLSFMGRVPPWMGGSVINSTAEDEWVETIATLVYYARNTAQVQFSILDPINEPDHDGIEGPQVNATQYTRLLHKLSVRLDAMGLSDVRLGAPNTANVGAGVGAYMPAMMGDPVVMAKVDHLAFHDYTGSTGGAAEAIAGSAYPGKNFWLTEVTNPWDILSVIGGGAAAVLVWDGYDSVYEHAILAGRGTEPPNDAGDGPAPLAYDTATGTYTPRKDFYEDAQIFRYVPPGSVRVGAAESNGALTVYAFHHPPSGRVTIVGRNEGGSNITVAGLLSNLPAVAGFEFYVTDADRNLLRLADVTVSGGSFSFVAPGDGYFTLTVAAAPDTTPPAVTDRSPASGATAVPLNSSATATFSEPVQANTIAFTLTGPGGAGVAATVTYDAATRTATLDPTADLAANATYTASVSGARDLAGNTMAPVSWSFTTATSATHTLWPSSARPAVESSNDSNPVELGVKFRSLVGGTVTGVRFYKGALNTGTHVGRLWTADGTVLATVTFAGETASGWQQALFASPVAVTANTTYVVSYHAPNGRYAYNEAYFASDYANGNLTAPGGANGVYRYGAGGEFPTDTFNSANYWVDVLFHAEADTTPPAVSVTSPAAGATVSGTVAVTASASDNVGVAGVQFLLDGVNLGAEDTTAPYSVSWNTTTATNGTHTLTARARDAAGNVTTSSAITVTVSNTGASGPVAAYGFNETTGTTASDSSGTGNAGTVSGATWTTGGRYGGTLSFDGINDWVTVNDANSLDLTTAMTLEAWVRPSTINGWETVLMKEASGSYAYGLYADNNGNDAGQARRPAAWIVQSGNYYGAEGTSQLSVDTWTHLAATYDGTTLRLYVNGTQANSVSQSGSIDVTTGALRIGGNSMWSEWFNGLIDEVRIYNRALSATEIQTDMDTPVGSPEHLLGEAVPAGDATPLSQEELRPLFDAAVTRWSVELDDSEAMPNLRAVRVEVMDLSGTTLGLADGAVIYLDANGAGHGWFLDPTPWEDSEFAPGLTNSPAAGRVDLLTVLAHEMGHILGLDDDSSADPFTGSVMADRLPVGVRRMHLEGLLPEAMMRQIPSRLQPLRSREPTLPDALMIMSVPPIETFPANAASVPSRRGDRESMKVWPEIDPPSDVFLRVGLDRRPLALLAVRANFLMPDSGRAWDDRFWAVELEGFDS